MAVMILGVSLAGVLTAYSAAYGLAESSLSATRAMDAAIAFAEEIRQQNPTVVSVLYSTTGEDGPHFTVDSMPNSAGSVQVNTSNPDFLEITISVCWEQKGGRRFGEDVDMNGILSTAEDVNGNGRVDSPAMLTFRMAR